MRSDGRRRLRGGIARGAFTLVELVVVLAILALMIVIGGVRTGAVLEGQRFAQATRAVVSTLVEAREVALTSGASVAVSRAPDGRGLEVRVGYPEADRHPTSVSRLQILGGVRWSGDDDGVIRFDPAGTATGGEIRLTGPGGRERVIRFHPVTGLPRVEDGDSPAVDRVQRRRDGA